VTDGLRAAHIAAGWGVVLLIALAAWWMQRLPFPPFRIEDETGVQYPLNAAMLAILLGLIIRNTVGVPASIARGRKQALRYALPVAIVLIGAGVDLAVFATIGFRIFAVILGGILIGFLAAYLLGKLIQLSGKTSALVGFGTAICGSSAILAAAPVIRADDEDIVLAIATVNLIGLVVMLVLPFWGGVIELAPESFGVWAGIAIHAVPQAITAGFAFGDGAGEVATLVKLVRVAMLAPVIFLTAVIIARSAAKRANGQPATATVDTDALRSSTSFGYARLVPWFIYGFAGMAIINTVIIGAVDTSEFSGNASGSDTLAANGAVLALDLMALLNRLGGLLLIFCMAAIGLDVQLRQLIVTGSRAIIAGTGAAIILALATLWLIHWLI
jgi:uncharacterized integral membrane protein (TIGR00698 family)